MFDYYIPRLPVTDYFKREGGYEKVTVDRSIWPYVVTKEFVTELPKE